MHGATRESGGTGRRGSARAALECLLVTAVFAAAGAWRPPDVNEAVYLTKARHAADPAWGRGDFFLETPDAHGVFYLVAGPLAASLPLERAAWIGRIAGWTLLAAAFRHAAAPLLATTWARVAAAAAFSLALRTTTAAGEWVIGGCEAKVFAWAAALAGLGEVAAGRFPGGCLWSGIATALHPIVGGWTLVATAATWLATAASAPRREAGDPPGPPAAGRAGAALVAAGIAAAAAGVLPALALSAGADDATRAAAARIYVVDRLSHHLLARTFADGMIPRHLLAAAVWWLLARFLPPGPPRRRVALFTGFALAISAAGAVVSAVEWWAPAAAYSLLRFYWFRLADVAVPFALATTVAAILEDDASCRRVAPVRPGWLRTAAAAILAVDVAAQAGHWPLPGRPGPLPRADAKVAAAAWADVCEWVRLNAPGDSRFLTPRGAASFTWRTGRSEVVSWKNSPQDAASLVEWRRRIVDCFSRTGSLAEMERSTASLGRDRLLEVARRYGADHAIVPLDAPLAETTPGTRLHDNGTYAVYRLPEADPQP